MTVTIKTDNKWKDFKYANEVPAKVLASQFDHLEDETDGFILYRGRWYHLSDFMRVPEGAEDLKGWHGYAGDSFFSGVLIKVSRDGEQYMIATHLS